MASSEVPTPVHDVPAGIAAAAEGVERALGARTWSLSPGEVRACLAEVAALAYTVEALKLSLVRASVARDDGEAPGRETAQWLQAHLRVSAGRARADVENAALTDPEDGVLRELGAALAAGQVSGGHVDAARAAVAALPAHLVRDKRAELAEHLTGTARRFTAPECRRLGAHLVGVLAPAKEDRLDPFAHERRQGSCFWDATGMLRIEARLAGAGAAAFQAAFDHFAAPARTGAEPDDPAQGLPGVGDTRTPAQRGADALELIGRLAATHPDAGTRGGEPPVVTVTATVEQLTWAPALAAAGATPPGLATSPCTGGPVPAGLLQRLACDAVLQLVVLDRAGAIVEMRSPARLATRAQRRALVVRDGGCAFPGCSAPAACT
jgi:Domain of unknown function (DUF222)